MDPRHFILMLFCGCLTNTVLSETRAISTVSPETIPFTSSVSNTVAHFGNGTENPLNQTLQVIHTPSGQPSSSPISRASGQPPTSPVPGSSGQLKIPPAPNSSGQPPLSSIRKSSGPTPVPPVPKSSSQPIASLILNSTRQQPGSPVPSFSSQAPESPISSSSQSPASTGSESTRQPPPSVTNSTRQSPVTPVHISSQKPPAPSGPSPTEQSISTFPTPAFNQEENNNPPPTKPQSSTANSIAAVLIGTILTFMIVTIFIIVVWKCFRKPIARDQNWAGRSPFADGETPDMCMDYSRENGKSVKRSSIVSLEIWKPNKSMLLADDLDVKLFDSSENCDECPKSDVEKTEELPNGTSEDSADRSTVGTAISSSEETESTPAPPLLDLDGPGNPNADSSNSLENDFSHLPPPLDCLNTEDTQEIPPLTDPSALPPPPEVLLREQEEHNSQVRNSVSPPLETRFPTPLDSSQQALDELLPPPPVELL
ncbi:protein EVI2B [Dromiciops gliroides]|uniref:protein EVI2B n=1 Tax=Dromiciops gliroides TaxID=33562 RepID=UPI001CC3534A|nr:protein EVI2B [Dromiciops gliroides]